MNGKTITGETDNFLLWLQTYDPATSPYFFDKFFIDKAGNVGIGTAAPLTALNIAGSNSEFTIGTSLYPQANARIGVTGRLNYFRCYFF